MVKPPWSFPAMRRPMSTTTLGAVEDQRSKLRGRPRDPYPSEKQQRVLGLVAAGLTTKEIAAQLHVSDACVKKHVGKLIARYGATNRASLVALALGGLGPGSRQAGAD